MEEDQNMMKQSDSLVDSGQFDSDDKRDNISKRCKNIQDLAANHQSLLNEANTLYQFFRDIEDEES